MTGKVVWCLVVAGTLLGLIHVGLSWPMYGTLSLEALWFAGSGLAVVCGALVNWFALRNPQPSGLWLVILVDLLIAGFFAAAWPLSPGPQTAAGFIVFSVLAAHFLTDIAKRRLLR